MVDEDAVDAAALWLEAEPTTGGAWVHLDVGTWWRVTPEAMAELGAVLPSVPTGGYPEWLARHGTEVYEARLVLEPGIPGVYADTPVPGVEIVDSRDDLLFRLPLTEVEGEDREERLAREATLALEEGGWVVTDPWRSGDLPRTWVAKLEEEGRCAC
jgi:hypothetical protein